MKINISLKQVIAFICFMPFIILPIWHDPLHFDAVLSSRRLLLLVLQFGLVAVVLYISFKKRQLIVPNKKAIGIGLLFLLLSAITIDKSLDLSKALSILIRDIEYLTMIILLVTTLQSVQVKRQFLKLFLVLPIFFLLIIILEYVGLEINYTILSRTRLEGESSFSVLFANPNIYASVCSLLIPLQLLHFFNSRNRIIRFLAIFNSLVLLILIIKLNSRAVNIALILGSSLIGLIYLKQKGLLNRLINSTKMKVFISLLLLIVGGLLVTKAYEFKEHHFDESLKYDSLIRNSSNYERLLMLDRTVDMLKDFPVVGVGLGNWPICIYQYKMYGNIFLNQGKQRVQRPHNGWLNIWAERGILPLLLFGLIVFYSLYWNYRNYIANGDTNALFYFFGIVIFTIVLFFSFPLERTYPSLIFCLYLALSMKGVSTSKKGRFFLLLAPIFLSLIIGVLFYSKRAEAEHFLFKAEQAKMNQNWVNNSKLLHQINQNYFASDHLGFPIDWHLATAKYHLEEIPESVKLYESALKKNPYNVNLMNDLASSYIAVKEIDSAMRIYNQALIYNPFFSIVRINLAILQYNGGFLDDAISNLEKIPLGNSGINDQEINIRSSIYRKKLRTLIDENSDRSKVNLIESMCNDNFLIGQFLNLDVSLSIQSRADSIEKRFKHHIKSFQPD